MCGALAMIRLILDILIYNLTPYKSFFFLLNITDKSLVYNVSVGIFVDLFITHTYFITTLFMILMWTIKKTLKINLYNRINYLIFNSSMVFGYYLVLACIYNFDWQILGNILVVNIIFILISYIKYKKCIKCVG